MEDDAEPRVVDRDVPLPEDFEGQEELLSQLVTQERYQEIKENEGLDAEYGELEAFEMARYAVRMIRGEFDYVDNFEYDGKTHANLTELQELLESMNGQPASGRLPYEETVEKPGDFDDQDAERIQELLGAEVDSEQRQTGGEDYEVGAERAYLDLRANYEDTDVEMHGQAPVDKTEEQQPDFEEW